MSRQLNFPLLLTWLRILAIPLIIIVYFLSFYYAHLLATILFALVAMTDWFDGYLARNLSQVTRLGAFLDPLADKLLVSISLVAILSQHISTWIGLPAAVIIGREITVSALREWMADMGKRASVAVTAMAKCKTFIQLIAIVVLLFYQSSVSVYFLYLGIFLLYLAAVLTLWSMVLYLKIAWPDLTLMEESQ